MPYKLLSVVSKAHTAGNVLCHQSLTLQHFPDLNYTHATLRPFVTFTFNCRTFPTLPHLLKTTVFCFAFKFLSSPPQKKTFQVKNIQLYIQNLIKNLHETYRTFKVKKISPHDAVRRLYITSIHN